MRKSSGRSLRSTGQEHTLRMDQHRDVLSQLAADFTDRIDLLLDAVVAPLAILDHDGCLLYWNRACQERLGIPFADVRGKRWTELVTDGADPANAALFPGTRETAAAAEQSASLLWKETPLTNGMGEIQYILCTGSDLAHDPLDEEKRRELERYRTLVESMCDIIFTLDTNHRYTGVYGQWPTHNGLAPENLLGKTARDIVGKQAAKIHEDANRRALKGEHVVYQWSVDTPAGTQYYQTSLSPIRNEAGVVTGIVGVGRDVTELKTAERKLRESEERYRRLVEMTPDAIVVISGGVIVYANQAALKLLGAEQLRHVLNAPLASFVHAHDEPLLRRFAEAVTKGKVPNRTEIRVTGLNRPQQRIAEVTGLAIEYFGQRALQLVMRDVTEHKQTEELLRKWDKLSVVGQLAAGVAHEIRNPLTSIRGFIQLMQSGEGAKKGYFDIILSEIDRIELIISEFLVLAKPQPANFQQQHLPTLLQQVLALVYTQAIINKVEFVCSCDENIPPVTGQEQQLKRVFVNVLKNAIEAMPDGGRVFIEVKRAPDDMVVVRIRDEGCGIPRDRLKTLGEPFYTTKERGTGLGLLISYKIIENHGGRIHIESEENKGTTVEVYLPAVHKQ